MADAPVKLTIKQTKFLKEYLKDGNGTRAAMVAYNAKDKGVASVIASENLVKLRNPMQLLMEQKGITPMNLIETVEDARTNATKWNEFTGEKEPDHNVRLKAVSQMSKWMKLDPEKEQNGQTNVQVNMGVSFTDD